MNLTVERLPYKSKPLWTILNDGERFFKTEEGFLTWETKSWCKYLIRVIEEEGVEACDAKINETLEKMGKDFRFKRTPNSVKYFMSFLPTEVERCILKG